MAERSERRIQKTHSSGLDLAANLAKELAKDQLSSPLNRLIVLAKGGRHLLAVEYVGLGDTLFVCTTCKRGPDEKSLGPDFIAALEKASLPIGMKVVGTACMTNCTRPLSVALAGPGKATYMLAEIDPVTDIEPLIDLSRLYAERADGQTKLLERPKYLRRKIIARVPRVM